MPKEKFIPEEDRLPEESEYFKRQLFQEILGFLIGAYIGYNAYKNLTGTLLGGLGGYGYGYFGLVVCGHGGLRSGALRASQHFTPYAAIVASGIGYGIDKIEINYSDSFKDSVNIAYMATVLAITINPTMQCALAGTLIGTLLSHKSVSNASKGCMAGMLRCVYLGSSGILVGAGIGLISSQYPDSKLINPAFYAFSIFATYGWAATALATCAFVAADRYENGTFILNEIDMFRRSYALDGLLWASAESATRLVKLESIIKK